MALMLSSCAHVTPHFSTGAYDPKTMEIVGPQRVTVVHQYVLGFGPGDSEFALAAYDYVIKKSGGDAIVNIVADEKTKYYFLFFFYEHSLTLGGLAVRYKKQ